MKLKTTEKGFTLVELLVALSIAAFVTAAASMTIITMMRLTPKTNNWAIALHQVQNAGYWISRDVLMSDTVTPGTGDTFLTLTQPQISTPNKTIVYQFEPVPGSLKTLMRNDAGQQTMIAEYIYYNPVGDPDKSTRVISYQNPVTLQITATSGDTTVTRQYEATQRVPAAPP